jgi:hypothetical protein
MKNLSNGRQIISTPADVARMLGLQSDALPPEIFSAFGRSTNFDAVLEIEEDTITVSGSETWEVRVIRDLPRCRLELRREGRGQWLRCADQVPQDVLAFFDAKKAREGHIETLRKWKSWEKLNWIKGRGQRRRARSGEIIAVVEIREVRRSTGQIEARVVIAPITDDAGLAVKIPLPCTSAQIADAVEMIRASYDAKLMVA